MVYDAIIQFKDKAVVQLDRVTISNDNEVKRGVHSASENDDKRMIRWYDESGEDIPVKSATWTKIGMTS